MTMTSSSLSISSSSSSGVGFSTAPEGTQYGDNEVRLSQSSHLSICPSLFSVSLLCLFVYLSVCLSAPEGTQYGDNEVCFFRSSYLFVHLLTSNPDIMIPHSIRLQRTITSLSRDSLPSTLNSARFAIRLLAISGTPKIL
jgi:hypothetical protein